MISAYPIILSALLLTLVVGTVVLGCLPAQLRLTLLPATPTIGACGFSLAMHWAGALLPSKFAAPLVGVSFVIALAWVIRSGRLAPRRAYLFLLLALGVALLPVALALRPLIAIDDVTLVQPSMNNDAFSYVTVTAWLADNPAVGLPGQDEPAAFGYARAHLDYGVRLGEEFLQAANSQVNGRDPASTWFPTAVAWLLLIPGAVAAAGALFGLNRWVSLAGGFGVSMSAIIASLVLNQNSASLLAVSIAPLVVALVAVTIEGRRRVPAWFTGLMVAGLASVYSEYLPVLAPVLVLLLVARPPRAVVEAAKRLLPAAIVAVVIAPFVTYNTARSLLFQSGVLAPGVQSAFIDAPGATIAGRLVGTSFMDEIVPWRATTVVAIVTLVVIALAGLSDPRTRVLTGATAGGIALIVTYLTAVHRFPYGQQRAVQVGWPIVLFGVVAGADVLVGVLRRRRRPSLQALWPAVALAGGAVVVVLNGANQLEYDVEPMSVARHIDRELLEGVGWVEELGGSRGEEATVVESSFFRQLWVAYELRDREDVAYPFLYPDYFQQSFSKWDGRMSRFVLVGRDAYVAPAPGVVVRENRYFRLLDLAKGSAVVTIVGQNWSGAEPTPTGVGRWMVDDGRLHVLRSADAPREVRLTLLALSDLAPLGVAFTTDAGVVLGRVELPSAPTQVPLELPEQPTTTIILHNEKKARPPSNGADPRSLSLYLEDAR